MTFSVVSTATGSRNVAIPGQPCSASRSISFSLSCGASLLIVIAIVTFWNPEGGASGIMWPRTSKFVLASPEPHGAVTAAVDRGLLTMLARLVRESTEDLEQFNYSEIADTLGVPVGTVRSRLARARSALQKLLWEQARAYGLRGDAATGAAEGRVAGVPCAKSGKEA